MKEEIKNGEVSVEYIVYIQWKLIVSVVRKILQTRIEVF